MWPHCHCAIHHRTNLQVNMTDSYYVMEVAESFFFLIQFACAGVCPVGGAVMSRVLSLCAQDVSMVIRIWPQHPLLGLHGVHPPSNPHFCHSQTTGAKNHHCWENGENHGGTGWHVLNVFNPVWILTPNNSFLLSRWRMSSSSSSSLGCGSWRMA